MMLTPWAMRAGAVLGLVGRAEAHKEVNFIFSCIQIQQQVLHITLHAALYT